MSSFKLTPANCPVPHIAWSAWSTRKINKDEAIALGVHRPYDFLGDDTRYDSNDVDYPYIVNNSNLNNNKTNMVSGLSPSVGQMEFDWNVYQNDASSSRTNINRNSASLVPTRYDYGAANAAYENVKQRQANFCASNALGQDCRNWTAARENMENQLSYGKVKLMGNELMPAPQAYRSNY